MDRPTVSIRFDATAAFVTPPALMLARTGAPNPIEESWRLEPKKKNTQDAYKAIQLENKKKGGIFEICSSVRPLWDSLFNVYKSTTTYEEYVLCVYLQIFNKTPSKKQMVNRGDT